MPDGGQVLLSQVLALPGVVPEPAMPSFQMEEEWPILEQRSEQALRRLQAMRQEEGRAMAQELLQHRDHIARNWSRSAAQCPVAVLYRDRLLDRVRGPLGELDVQIDRSDLIKEVAIFAERSRHRRGGGSAGQPPGSVSGHPQGAGRRRPKLEFLTQEMFRETNTIGSKASDVEISRHVVEIKGTLEKIRELVQNIE